MPADSLATAAALQSLHDIVIPEPVPLTPETMGWGIVAMVVVVAGLWLLWRAIRHHRLTRYRREAAAELKGIERLVGQVDGAAIVPQLASLLKRTALSGYGRARVAALAGEEWLAFLDQTGGRARFAERGEPFIAYGVTTVPEDHVRTLLQLTREWIRGHDVRV